MSKKRKPDRVVGPVEKAFQPATPSNDPILGGGINLDPEVLSRMAFVRDQGREPYPETWGVWSEKTGLPVEKLREIFRTLL